MSRDVDYLKDILQAITDLEEIAMRGRAEFLRSRLLQGSALYRFHIIAEAAGRLSPSLIAQHKNVDWDNIRGFRNLIIHDYGRVSFRIVADTLANDVPALKLDIERMLSDLGAQHGS